MGAVVEGVRRRIPASYRAMLASSTPYFTYTDFQAHADYVKFRLFATVTSESNEGSAYDPLLLGFMAKVTTLQIIPAAIDFWMNQRQTIAINSGTTTETSSYDSRVNALERMRTDLAGEVRQEMIELRNFYGFTNRQNLDKFSPAVRGGLVGSVTMDPDRAALLCGSSVYGDSWLFGRAY